MIACCSRATAACSSGHPRTARCSSITSSIPIRELLGIFPKLFDPERVFTRCTECNAELGAIVKSSAKGRVPKRVYETESRFWECPRCLKIFWRGSHYDNALDLLRDIQARPLDARWRF